MTDEQLVLRELSNGVVSLTLNRPRAYNALSLELIDQLADLIEQADTDPAVRVLLITGGTRVFAAGADIKAMVQASPIDLLERRMIERWDRIRSFHKPLIAAVSGMALGGGCELALMCDLIVASETAEFGQPEINIGVIPGAGGTQRLTRAIGPYRAMEMILTGKRITAAEALAYGLVNRVVPVEALLAEAQALAAEIAARPPLAIQLAREALRYGVDHTLAAGLELERRNFYLLFASEDQKEGMRAFIEKRSAEWTGR